MKGELKKLGEDWRWGAPLARAPDLCVTERLAAKAVIDHLAGEGWQLKSLESPPQRQLSPDVVAVLEGGRRVGFEVTELCDADYIERMQAVKKGKEALRPPRSWDPTSVQAELCARLVSKDQKRRKALLSADGKRRIWGEPLDEYLVVIHTDEPLIISQPHVADAALKQITLVTLSQVTRAFFLIWYVPRSIGPRPRIYEIPIQFHA